MQMWMTDPNTKQPSVSLTLLVISCLFMAVLGVLTCTETIKTMGPFTEVFYSFTALYFSRRLTISGKIFGSEKAEKIENQIEGIK